MPSPIPVIATGKFFQIYLDAARSNLANMLQLATALKDAEFAHEARAMLESFDEAAADALELIAEANANSGAFDGGEQFWRESIHAENADLAIAAAGRMVGHAEKAKALRAKLVPASDMAA